jgi:hypothetical protein
MSGFKTMKQRNVERSIELLFKGLDDDVLKNVLLCAYAGQDESILEEIRVAREAELEELKKQFTEENNAENICFQVPSEEEKEEGEKENQLILNSVDNITNGKD